MVGIFRAVRASGVLAAAALFCLLLGGGGNAFAANESPYKYDALLSLTGGCTKSAIDPVPDPGCPDPPHPPKSFSKPTSIAVDPFGNEYVASYGAGGIPEGSEGRIDVFSPAGEFITELADPFGPKSVAVDSKGNLYVIERRSGLSLEVARYSPSVFKPEEGEIAYGNPREVIDANESAFTGSVAVDPSDDHLFVAYEGTFINEYGPVVEGENDLLETISPEGLSNNVFIAVDGQRRRLYASSCPGFDITDCWVMVFDADSYELIEEVTGESTPQGEFVSNKGWTSVAVDEATGAFFVGDLELTTHVYKFDENLEYLSTLDFPFQGGDPLQIAVSNAVDAPNYRYLFVPSHPGGVGHAFAFEPPGELPPVIESASAGNVGETEVELRAEMEPEGGDTHYVFEYVTETEYQEDGFASARIAGEGDIAASEQEARVLAPVSGLVPGGGYRFRVTAKNLVGEDEVVGAFITYSDAPVSSICPNEVFRVGASAVLPDCRAFELVTPVDPNGRSPRGVGFVGDRFTTLEASPSGGAISFLTEGGVIPGTEGAGGLNGDLYRSTRGAGGWETVSAGPSGAETVSPNPGSTSPDQGYAFWTATREGSAVIDGEATSYVHYPDGHSELIGRGTLGPDPRASGRLITENGTHIVFQTQSVNANQPVQLEENAPPAGTTAVYDRTADEVTHVVSLLPGDVVPTAGENASYVGASEDGDGIAFSIGQTLYLRVDNATSFEIGNDVEFAGISEDGERIFYVEGNDLFAFDTGSEEVISFSEVGNATVVNVAPGGSRAYFVSPSVLGEENPNGAIAQAGKENLYLSREGQIRFVATVTARDVEGEKRPDGQVDGLGLWTSAVDTGRLAVDPSRLTPDGSVLLLQSRSNLDSHDSGGLPQIYRYDSVADRLHCISCIPTGIPGPGGAGLQSTAPSQDSPEPFSSFGFVRNLRPDGRRAFFESDEALVSTDADGVKDVYEWEEEGEGSCERPGGCVYLITSGQSAADNYLYGISASGDDVFFTTSDILVPGDDETRSIYDARVGGGFARQEDEETCEGEGCRPSLIPTPPLPQRESGARSGSGNVTTPAKRCPKGKRKVKRHGKFVCVKKKKHHRKAGRNRGANR